ncbi:unnamed protein product [Sphagnum balticum]
MVAAKKTTTKGVKKAATKKSGGQPGVKGVFFIFMAEYRVAHAAEGKSYRDLMREAGVAWAALPDKSVSDTATTVSTEDQCSFAEVRETRRRAQPET